MSRSDKTPLRSGKHDVFLFNPVPGPLSSGAALPTFLLGLLLEIAIVLHLLRTSAFRTTPLMLLLVVINVTTWIPLMLAYEISLGTGTEFVVIAAGEIAVVLIEFGALVLVSKWRWVRPLVEPVPVGRLFGAALLANVVSLALGIAVFLWNDQQRPPFTEFTVAQMQVLRFKSVVDEFYIREKRPPKSLRELIEPDASGRVYIEGIKEVPADPWGTPYRLIGEGAHRHVSCAGPDRRFDTDDDITSADAR